MLGIGVVAVTVAGLVFAARVFGADRPTLVAVAVFAALFGAMVAFAPIPMG